MRKQFVNFSDKPIIEIIEHKEWCGGGEELFKLRSTSCGQCRGRTRRTPAW